MTDAVDHLLSVFDSPQYQPPVLPDVASRLLELAGWADVDFEAVIGLLEKDALLAAKVLQIAQSPLYPSKAPILSLRQAVVRLGLQTLVGIFFEATLKLRVFKAPGYEKPMADLQRHSTATAYLTRIVCRYARVNAEHAFLCGLLHDVGIAASLITLTERKKGPKPPAFEIIWPAIKATHEKASGVLASRWKLPPEIGLVIACHHDVSDQTDPVASAVCVADWVSSQFGAGLVDESDGSTVILARNKLGIGDPELKLLLVEAKDVVDQLG